MDMLSNISLGLSVSLTLTNLAFCFFGVLLGTLVGVLPGIGAIAAIGMILPVTFYLEPTTAIVMLAGVYYGAEYGGSTAAILLNLPGTPSSAVTSLDGYPLAKGGKAGIALFVTTIASFIGGSLAIILLMFAAPALAQAALAFGPAEFFAVTTLGLVASAGVAQGAPLKGVTMVLIGMLLGTIGADANTGIARFTFNNIQLYDGLSIVAIAMGLFGVAEIVSSIQGGWRERSRQKVSLRSMIPSKTQMREMLPATLRGSAIGSFFGVLPGAGPTIASFLSYGVEKRISTEPGKFGKGAIEGVAAPEASNNAAVQAAFIPTLTLGIPGSATLALMMGALIIHGVQPGPQMMSQHPAVFWGLVMSFWIGNVLLLILNIPFIGVWVRLLQVPYNYLYPVVLALICIGVYSVSNNPGDLLLVLAFGVFGCLVRVFGFECAPLLIGFVLGPLLEDNLRRAMVLSRGNFINVVSSPISASAFLLTLAVIAWMLRSALRPATVKRSVA